MAHLQAPRAIPSGTAGELLMYLSIVNKILNINLLVSKDFWFRFCQAGLESYPDFSAGDQPPINARELQ